MLEILQTLQRILTFLADVSHLPILLRTETFSILLCEIIWLFPEQTSEFMGKHYCDLPIYLVIRSAFQSTLNMCRPFVDFKYLQYRHSYEDSMQLRTDMSAKY